MKPLRGIDEYVNKLGIDELSTKTGV